VVDNQVLYEYIKKTYGIDSVLIEYGGDHAVSSELTPQLKEKYSFLDKPYDITISRAQEDMNIHILLEAYEKFGKRNLVVVSNWEISDYGMELKKKYLNRYENIFIQDAIYDLSELNAIRSNALLYIHSHSLCGTAPSLVEAMSLGLPVISFDVATNRATTENDSNYFSDANSLIKILNNLDEISLKSLSKKMKEIAERRYKWSRITGLYRDQIK
jgi:glycosyltransferase involved in cell wall biosynthesis